MNTTAIRQEREIHPQFDAAWEEARIQALKVDRLRAAARDGSFEFGEVVTVDGDRPENDGRQVRVVDLYMTFRAVEDSSLAYVPTPYWIVVAVDGKPLKSISNWGRSVAIHRDRLVRLQ